MLKQRLLKVGDFAFVMLHVLSLVVITCKELTLNPIP